MVPLAYCNCAVCVTVRGGKDSRKSMAKPTNTGSFVCYSKHWYLINVIKADGKLWWQYNGESSVYPIDEFHFEEWHQTEGQ